MQEPFLHFRVDGLVKPKERARMGFGGKFYTPDQTKTYEREIAIMGSLEMGAEGPSPDFP